MELRNVCYNCFQPHEGNGPCPHCGFDLEEHIQKYPMALWPGTMLNERYVIGRILGQGGFGITYLALDTQLDSRVAIKEFMPGEIATRIDGATVSVMSADKTEDFGYGTDRFLEEARTLAKFSGNPNIAGVSSYFNVKLLDFGSARYSIGDKSKSLDVILKVGYAPKEQYIRRGRQGPYTDVYSCAACFYAALTGYPPPQQNRRWPHRPKGRPACLSVLPPRAWP